jgi:hypothetical protein
MFLRSVIAALVCLLYSCSNNLELPEGKKTIAQFVFLLPDRAELSSEVASIDEQMNAYRLSIVPDDNQNSENCDSVGMLKKYQDNKQIEIELKANCAYSVSLNLGAYQTTPKFLDEDEGSDGSDPQDGFSLTDEDEDEDEDKPSQRAENGEDIPPLDFVFYETSFDLQKGQTVTGIVQHTITVNVTRDGQKIGLKTSELDVDIPASPGISQVKQLSDESAGDDETDEKEQRFVGYDTIGPVIDQHCAYAGCHAAGSTSPDLSSFSRISNGTYEGEDVTEAIYQAVIVVKNMPFSGELNQEELSLFEDWKQSGFAE